MKRRGWIIGGGVALFCLLGGALALWLATREPVFRGRTESEWVSEIIRSAPQPAQFGTSASQVWTLSSRSQPASSADPMRDLFLEMGPEGARFLGDALDRCNSQSRKAYRAVLKKLPAFVVRWLPAAPSYQSERTQILSLLRRMGPAAAPAETAIARSLHDENWIVMLLAVQCYPRNSTMGWGGVIDEMDPKTRRRRLPEFVRALERVEAAPPALPGPMADFRRAELCRILAHYPGQGEAALPLLTNLLVNPNPSVRLAACQALVGMDRDTAIRVGVVQVALDLFKTRQVSIMEVFVYEETRYEAAAVLGQLVAQPEVCLPPLILAARSMDLNLAEAAIEALGHFTKQADQVVPVLIELLEKDPHLKAAATREALRKLAPDRPELWQEPAVFP